MIHLGEIWKREKKKWRMGSEMRAQIEIWRPANRHFVEKYFDWPIRAMRRNEHHDAAPRRLDAMTLRESGMLAQALACIQLAGPVGREGAHGSNATGDFSIAWQLRVDSQCSPVPRYLLVQTRATRSSLLDVPRGPSYFARDASFCTAGHPTKGRANSPRPNPIIGGNDGNP